MSLFTIILPLHNRAGELPQTLDSLRAQTLADWETIVVDDRSTDDAPAIAREYAARDARFRVVTLPDSQRLASAARNHGLRLASGELIVFLDSDDLLDPTALEHRAAFLRAHPELDFCVNRCQLFQRQPRDVPQLFNADTGADDLDRFLNVDVPWQTTGPTWRRGALEKLVPPGGAPGEAWDGSVLSGQDWEFHLRAVALGLRYARVPVVDCHWRTHGPHRDSVGKQALGKDHARARPALLRRIHDFLTARGLLNTPARRNAYAALYFKAADTLARRVSRSDGRRVLREAYQFGLLDRARFREADRYLFLQRWPALGERRRRRILQTWPRDLLPRHGRGFLTAPLDPDRAPTVSVVTSAYNNADYVEAAVRSILGQTFRDFEFILIDDGSTDGTGALLRDLAAGDARVRLVQRENRGLTASLNEGLALARGAFVARMDADDIADPERFEKQLAFLRANPDHVAVGSRIETIDPFDVPIDRPDEHRLSHEEIDAALMRGSGWALVHPVVTFRTSALRQVGGYREHYNKVEDLDLFLRLAEVGRLANLPDVLLRYRQHLGSVNHQHFARQRQLKVEVLREAHARRGLPTPTSFDFNDREHVDANEQHRFWGWRALKVGRPEAAKRHAWRALRARPYSWETWKLMRSALRGH